MFFPLRGGSGRGRNLSRQNQLRQTKIFCRRSLSIYINVLLTIISFSPIPSPITIYFLPFKPISTQRSHFLACQTRDQIFKKSNKHRHLTSHEIHLLDGD